MTRLTVLPIQYAAFFWKAYIDRMSVN